MRGFVVDGASGSVMDVPVPEPADGEALVRVLVAAVCATDIEIMKGYMGFTGLLRPPSSLARPP